MADTVYTADGKAHTMLRENSLAELVEEVMGMDVARRVGMLQQESDEAERLQEELEDAENRADDLAESLHHIQQKAQYLLHHLGQEDITTKEIKECCEEIIRLAD